MTGLPFLGSLLLGRRRHILAGLVVGGSLVMGAAKASTAHPRAAQRNATQSAARQQLLELVRSAAELDDAQKLERVNQFFNQRVRYGEDLQVWGRLDYWASPLETLERGAGDCEDFAIAKYFTLRLLGISESNLRLIYTTLDATRQAHMVLGYWSDGAQVPLVLDSLVTEIRPLSQRHDLLMQFAFDAEHLYRFDHDRLVTVGDAQLIPRWRRLQERVLAERLSAPEPVQLANETTQRPSEAAPAATRLAMGK